MKMSDTEPLVHQSSVRRGSRCLPTRRTCIVVVAVFLGVLVPAAISVGVAVVKLRAKYTPTVELTDMNRNATWAVHFNGKYVSAITMEASYAEYGPFMNLYAFASLPPLDVHREYTRKIGTELLFPSQFDANKMYLNAGSCMNVSFCGSSRVRVLVIQYDAYISDLHDLGVRRGVKKNWTFAGHGDDCDNGNIDTANFCCTESAAYQFVFLPAGQAVLVLRHFEFNGDTTQYNVDSGSTDHCNTSREVLECSVNLQRSAETEVVVGVGNISFPNGGNNNIGLTLKGSLRTDVIGTIAGGVMGCAFTVAAALSWYCTHGKRMLCAKGYTGVQQSPNPL